VYLLVTCYLYNDGQRRSSLNAQISPPVLVQSVFERVNKRSVDNFLSQVVPVARYSVAKEKFLVLSLLLLITSFLLWPLRLHQVLLNSKNWFIFTFSIPFIIL